LRPPRRPLWKKMWNPSWWQRNGCDSRLVAKNLITTIWVNLCCLLHVSLGFGNKSTWIVVIKVFAISLPSSHFLAATLNFKSFFTMGGCTLFLQLGCFGFSFCNYILCSISPSLIKCLLLSIFSFPIGDNLWIYDVFFVSWIKIYS